jgi:hypothetical protein
MDSDRVLRLGLFPSPCMLLLLQPGVILKLGSQKWSRAMAS